MFIAFATTVAAVTFATMAGGAAILHERQSDASNFALSINGARFDINYLQTFRLSYANNSAFIGEMKYQDYAEPLIISGAGFDGGSDGLSFLSIHQTATGSQSAFIIPHQSQPLGFSVPHGTAAGVRTTGFSFGPAGALLNIGLNRFYACQNAELAAINTYQIYWLAAGHPVGFSCIGPLKINRSDACARI